MICKLCGEDKKLIESHIIPRSFYEPLKESGQVPNMITDTPGVYPKKMPTGVYDKTIVCEACEQLFSPWDDYGHEFIFQELEDSKYIYDGNEKVAYNFGHWDYNKLKLFFLSVLWRASVSTHEVFKLVDLGPFEPMLRQQILDGDAGNNRYFAVALSKFDESANKTGMLNPHRTRLENVIHYKLYLANYSVVIKVSREFNPRTFEDLYIAPDKDVYCLIRDFNDSQELKALVETAKLARVPAK